MSCSPLGIARVIWETPYGVDGLSRTCSAHALPEDASLTVQEGSPDSRSRAFLGEPGRLAGSPFGYEVDIAHATHLFPHASTRATTSDHGC
jgi:hypothetical protein